tara:strand:+ start:419 stop:631 length:213 start_codon:yes stop_codon:yes gene_type:complete
VALASVLDAFADVADLFAAISTSFADFCAGLAVMNVVVAVAAHEVNTCRTGCGTIKHQFDVGLLDVSTTL